MDYKFSKKDGAPIDKLKAKQWIKKYDEKHIDGIKSYFFGTDIIKKVIDHHEAVGMRVHFAYGDEGKLQVVLIGAREDGSNIWPSDVAGKDAADAEPTVADGGLPCPPYCPK